MSVSNRTRRSISARIHGVKSYKKTSIIHPTISFYDICGSCISIRPKEKTHNFRKAIKQLTINFFQFYNHISRWVAQKATLANLTAILIFFISENHIFINQIIRRDISNISKHSSINLIIFYWNKFKIIYIITRRDDFEEKPNDIFKILFVLCFCFFFIFLIIITAIILQANQRKSSASKIPPSRGYEQQQKHE